MVTEYTYNDLSFNLSNLKVVNTYNNNRCLMDNAYTYDAVDNVTQVTNTAPIPSTGIGGNITHNYSYDGLYRLQAAEGTYAGNAGDTVHPAKKCTILKIYYVEMDTILRFYDKRLDATSIVSDQ